MRKEQFKRLRNPSSKFLDWNGEVGKFYYYDKERGENIFLEKIEGVVLTIRQGVRGWSEKFGASISSTEIASINEPLKVFTFKEGKIIELAKGYYPEIKEKVKMYGGKYAKFLYVMPKGKDEIWHITLTGSALNWIEFEHKRGMDLAENYLGVESAKDMKKGRINYKVPVWQVGGKILKKDDEQAEKLFSSLLEYFQQYKSEIQGEIKDDIMKEEEKGSMKPRRNLGNDLPF